MTSLAVTRPVPTPAVHPLPQARLHAMLFRGLQAFLLILALSRYDATSWVFRGTAKVDFFNWFWRFRWLGFLSFFDIFLAALVSFAALASVFSRQRRTADGLLFLLPLLVGVGALVGYLNPVSATTSQDMLFQFRSYLYLGGAYFVATRVPWTGNRFRDLARLLLVAAFGTVLLLVVENVYLPPESRVWKYGRFTATRDVADFSLLLFALVFLAALVLSGRPRRKIYRLAVLVIVGWSVWGVATGVGKGTVFVVASSLIYLAISYRLHRRPWMVPSAIVLAAAAAGLVLWFFAVRRTIEPGSPLYLYTTFRTDDSSVGTRAAELRNIAANLDRRNGWLWGIGLGNRWYEYVEQPKDPGAFPEHEQGQPWHLGMHVPLARLVLDFGLVGLGLLLAVLAVRFRRSWRLLRRGGLEAMTRASIHAAWLAIAYELVVNSLSVPKGALLAGILLGTLAGLERSYRGGAAGPSPETP